MKPTLTVTSDFVDQVNDVIRKFKRDTVLVGIPSETSPRQNTGEINNATILALNEYGSPANNIPARPVMKIGIRKVDEEIAAAFKKGAQDALSRGIAALSPVYNRVGIIASNSIKKVINAQEGIEPPSPATIRARESRGFKGVKALIVTGQMRNAITYVVKGEE